MTIHIGANKDDIADVVLMPGDPYRAKWAAETFLSGAKLVNEVRGMLGFTGEWNGHRVTIQGSGMGMPFTTHVGGIYSSDTFYDERPDLNTELQRHGILGVEMEAAELYTLAARYGRRALGVMTVSDHLLTGEALPSDQRERSFGDMIDIALGAAFA